MSKPDEITNTVVWIIRLSVKKLINIASSEATPNQNIKKPTVKISIMKNTPEAINHICHIVQPPIFSQLYYTINFGKFKEISQKLL